MTTDKEIEKLSHELHDQHRASIKNQIRQLKKQNDRLYYQLESLFWLQRRVRIKGHLPPLRGWAASPDVLLKLHSHIMKAKPEVIVELGSGSSTVVIADALCQNGSGKLVSLDHNVSFAKQTMLQLQDEGLEKWVDLRVSDLEEWNQSHMTEGHSELPPLWYSRELLEDVERVDLVWVDGPPGGTCRYARYPAVPAVLEKLSPEAEIWIDDAARLEERSISQRWVNEFNLWMEYCPMEKGMARFGKR